MSAENYCQAPIMLLWIVAVSTVPIAGAFAPNQIAVPQMPMTRMSSAAGVSRVSKASSFASVWRSKKCAASTTGPLLVGSGCGSVDGKSIFASSALHLASSGAASPGDSNGDSISDSSNTKKPRRGIFAPFRATMRGITGFSLTALRASLRAATGISITATSKAFVGLFPLWFRYFMQPFLVLYYAPLMMMRSWVGETRTSKAEQMAAHEKLVEGWKHAIEVAEAVQANEYWPVHVDADGNIVASMPPEPEDVWTQNPLNEAVLESVEIADAIENE
mmetsp:Transcript_33228/g.98003  ORF Transcript_33228/g.98003 Transcript_33228/m.98003 type:complete len:276 (-) Transcript_33228:135-962(-)